MITLIKRGFVLYLISFFCYSTMVFAKSTEQIALEKLSFLIGDWQGYGSSYPKEKSKRYEVVSKVEYDLAGDLLVINHRSFRSTIPVLRLHTIIYYNIEDQYYYYNAYTKTGARPFKCQLIMQQFVCKRGEDYRLVFQRTAKGEFNEYGEKLVNGQWTKTFEDLLLPNNK